MQTAPCPLQSSFKARTCTRCFLHPAFFTSGSMKRLRQAARHASSPVRTPLMPPYLSAPSLLPHVRCALCLRCLFLHRLRSSPVSPASLQPLLSAIFFPRYKSGTIRDLPRVFDRLPANSQKLTARSSSLFASSACFVSSPPGSMPPGTFPTPFRPLPLRFCRTSSGTRMHSGTFSALARQLRCKLPAITVSASLSFMTNDGAFPAHQ